MMSSRAWRVFVDAVAAFGSGFPSGLVIGLVVALSHLPS